MQAPLSKVLNALWFLYGTVVFSLFFSVWDQPLGREGKLPAAPTILAVASLVPFFIRTLLSDLARKTSSNTISSLRGNRAPLASFLVVTSVSLTLSLLPGAYWGEEGKWIMLIGYGFVISFLAIFVPLQPVVRRALPFFTFLALCLLLWSMMMDVMKPGTYSGEPSRAAGFPGNANFAALVTVLLCASALDYTRRRAAWVDAAFLFVGGAAVFTTMSRSGILNFMVLVCFYCYHRFIKSGIKVRDVIGLTFGLGTLLTILFAVLPLMSDDLTLFKGKTRLGRFLSEDRMDDGSAVSRYAAVQDSLRLVNESPLLGHGTGHSRTMAELPHNLYLMQWVNNGLPGLLSYVALLATSYIVFQRRRFRPGQAFILVATFGSLFSHNLLDQRPFLMLLGILLARSLIEQREPSTLRPSIKKPAEKEFSFSAGYPRASPLTYTR